MFERYIICADSLRNISDAGTVSGFAFDVRLAYYRGLALSMVEGFEVEIDGMAVPADAISFEVAGERFTFAQLEGEAEARWEFTEPGTVRVAYPGGVPPGPHALSVVEILRISYMPEPARRADHKILTVRAGTEY